MVFDTLTKLTLVDRDDCIQIISIVAKLKPEIDNHFAEEEFLFRKYNYPHADKHTQEHHNFCHDFDDIMKRYESGQHVAIYMVIFLKNWLINHILYDDMKYKYYFLEKNIDVTADLA